VYLCATPVVQADCSLQRRPCGPIGCQSWCSDWGQVVGYTGPWTPTYTYGNATKAAKVALAREGWVNTQQGMNPLMLSIDRLTGGFYPTGHSSEKAAFFVLGVHIAGTDPMNLLKVNFITPPVNSPSTPSPAPEVNQTVGHNKGLASSVIQDNNSKFKVIDYSLLKPADVVRMATGFTEGNLWLSWVAQTAQENSKGDCIACASARPNLVTVPAPLISTDTSGYQCMMNLTWGRDTGCQTLGSLFPPISNKTIVGPVTPEKGNGSYVCFNITAPRCTVNHAKPSPTVQLGAVDPSWCQEMRPGAELGWWARAGLYFYCGQPQLHVRVPPHSRGVCAMVRLRTPLILLGDRLTHLHGERDSSAALTRRRRRHILTRRSTPEFDLSIDNPTYMDAIGVPRGVPNEYKLADQVAAGFENIPILAAFFPVTPNKNVDRINYVHYNVLRLTNLTRDAVAGLAEQMAPTSLMAVQNRMALDMLLAEKGGVCAMFGDMCCTFIPNNTAPDGSVAKALEGLRTLSKTMHEHSGIDNPLDDWLTKVFGKWKTLIMSLFVSLAIFVAIVVTCGCCCIPCIRSLAIRLITTTIEGKAPSPLVMPLQTSPDSDTDEEDLIRMSEIV